MKFFRSIFLVLAVLALCGAEPALAYKSAARDLAAGIELESTVVVPAAGSIEVGFSPRGGAEALVLRVIDSARSEVKVMSYSFTSSTVVAALLRAARRGVVVSLVADYKSNLSDDRSGKGRAALSALAEAGCDVRVISTYPIHHDKVLIVDRQTVELGSFNFSAAAARVNSENVLVNWNNPALAGVYLRHFERNWRQAEPFRPRY